MNVQLKTLLILIFILWVTISRMIAIECNRRSAAEEVYIFGFTNIYDPQVEDIQKDLMRARFYPGLIDGVMDHKTRKAIKEFQKAKDLNVTGFIDVATWKKLSISEGKHRSSVLSGKNSINSKDRIKDIQRALKNAGFNPGSIDGELGYRTRRAIRCFQRLNKINERGAIGPKTWEALVAYLTN